MEVPDVRVLFLHGLEGHPNGSKVRAMRAQGLEVSAPDMQMGLMKPFKANSALRQLPWVREFQAPVALALGLVMWLGTGGSSLAVLVALVAWLALRREALFAAALSRSFDACVAVAADAVARSDADVLVGSSWGGAVACELIARGAWSGPTVLLAPALLRMHRIARRADGDARRARFQERVASMSVAVFHDPTDDVIPFADSEALCQGTSVSLRPVSAGGHRLLGLLDSGELVTTVHEVAR